jgi:hypothetical protein
VCVCVCVCMLNYSARTDALICTKLGMLIPFDQEEILERQNSEKMSCVRVPVGKVTTAQKLSTIEKQRKCQSCLFRRGDYRNEGQNAKNLSCVRVPVKMVYVARKLRTIEKRHQHQSCLFR